jgi:hypothetical protein
MARPGQIDHVAQGIARVPEKLRADRISRYLAVYLAQYNDIEEAVQQLVDAFLTWETFGSEFSFVLETIGALFDQPWPDGFTASQYSFILQARARSRRSEGSLPDVYRVANFLARGNTENVRVFPLVPKNIQVVFINLQASDAEKVVYEQILLDTIDAVDGLEVQYVTTGTAFYDFGEYDSEVYAP